MPEQSSSRFRFWRWLGPALILVALLFGLTLAYSIYRARPILEKRIIETLTAQFEGNVELSGLSVSIANGFTVSGSGLKVHGWSAEAPVQAGTPPLLTVQNFRFQIGWSSLLRSPMHVHSVAVQGMVLGIPPRENRPQIRNVGKWSKKISIIVDELVCNDAQLVIYSSKPGKDPLTFDISQLKMEGVGRGMPMRFEATLTNPRPVGDIRSVGKFGPFDNGEPSDTPVLGDYSFTNADLGTLRGIGGILSSVGNYHGTLGRIEVDGATDTPDFRLARSGHPVGLHTDFHAIVNGTDGDTYLEPVKARFLHTAFTAQGKVVKVKSPAGHDIELNVVLDGARIEDLLVLGVKTEPPVMSGPVAMRTRMSLPPGPDDISDRLKLSGTFDISSAEFSNDKIQDRIDALSLRAQGKAKLAQEHLDVNAHSKISGTFRLDQGAFTFSELNFTIPGAHSEVRGQYSLDGNVFDFHGKLMLDAKLSQMTTGWKSILLKPVDPFFSKHGAGTELPFKITGTRSEPHFGLDFGHHDAEVDPKEAEVPHTK
ncbi:MAG TPA: AsmA-like C-terminal region-containing protein [Candidatus Sulfotelmatobacter sp.]|nr:AsmA-like C-terminal region-containing protein [Candidatus Sulfotelmatobacter sp.]